MEAVLGEQLRPWRGRKPLHGDLGHPCREPIGRRLQCGCAPAEDGSKRPGEGREGRERSNAGDDHRRVADPLPRGGHQRYEVVRKCTRGSIAGGIVDAESDDDEVRRLARDPRISCFIACRAVAPEKP